jgi:predicted AlkP superfamily phosphohydrolase/phosphomutase
MKKHIFTLLILLSFIVGTTFSQKPTKLYWFIPDGLRAEPDLFKIYDWANKGYLPNIKYMMDHGAHGYSVPVFPTHTPVNFAALLTGATPKVNGVADGPMHTEGFPLSKVSVGGFRSSARRVPAIWTIMEKAGKKTVILSVPGSTPPEITRGMVVRGRWGGWGAETYSLVFEKQTNNKRQFEQGRSVRLFFNGPKLAQYIGTTEAKDWGVNVKSYSPPVEIAINAYGLTLYGYIYDNTDDKKVNYNHILFSFDKKQIIADIKQGEWGTWTPCTVLFENHPLESNIMPRVIKLDDNGYFRIRILYNNLNSSLTMPEEAAKELTDGVGPLVDYPDNYPPQLIFFKEDKSVFQDEMKMSFDWHKKAIGFIMNKYHPDVVIHDIYSPNQMLTSRWWLGYVDPASDRYETVDAKEHDKLWNEVKGMYLQIDSMIGQILANVDSNTLVVFSSDHGACPLNTSIMVNNLFAKSGYLKFNLDSITGEPIIDYAHSKAIYLKMDGVYINPAGLDGNWKRASGPDYEKLRDEIAKLLTDLQTEKGEHPITSVTKWEDAEQFLDLPKDRVGDLIISNKPGFGFYEEFTEKMELFTTPLITGYKQAILGDTVKAMWTPFIIMGKGVKEGVTLNKNISHIDQLPTILKLMGMEIPSYVEGKPIDQVFK